MLKVPDLIKQQVYIWKISLFHVANVTWIPHDKIIANKMAL